MGEGWRYGLEAMKRGWARQRLGARIRKRRRVVGWRVRLEDMYIKLPQNGGRCRLGRENGGCLRSPNGVGAFDSVMNYVQSVTFPFSNTGPEEVFGGTYVKLLKGRDLGWIAGEFSTGKKRAGGEVRKSAIIASMLSMVYGPKNGEQSQGPPRGCGIETGF